MKLSKENLSTFETKAQNISTEEEKQVLSKIETEFEHLQKTLDSKPSKKLQELLQNAQLLFEVLNNTNFPLSSSSRKWIVFGLHYLVSDVDLIPDGIPQVGYMDDTMVINWVIYMLEYDLKRYQFYKEIETTSGKREVLQILKEGTNNKEVIFLSGFIYQKEDASYIQRIQDHITQIPKFENAGIRFLNHSFEHLEELYKTLKVVDHDLKLKPVFDFDKCELDWMQAKKESELLGKALVNEIQTIRKQTPEKSIVVVAIDLGCISIAQTLKNLNEGDIETIYMLGALNAKTSDNAMDWNKANKTYNFHSENDYTLKFVNDHFENKEEAIGLTPFLRPETKSLENINCSSEIKNHFEYKFKLSLLLDQTC